MIIDQRALRDVFEGIGKWRLWWVLAKSEIQRRYARTILGPIWTTLSMGIFVATLGAVFSLVWGMSLSTYLPYLATGFMIWMPMSQIVMESGGVFTEADHIIKQIRVPFTLFPCIIVARNLMVFAHHLIVWALVVLIFHVPVNWNTLLALPGLAVFAISGVWISMVIGIFCARYRDVQQLLVNIVQILLFITPILWTPDKIGPAYRHWVDWNIVHHFIELVRQPLLGQAPSAISWAMTMGTAAMGWLFTLLVLGRYRRYIVYWL